MVMVVTLLIAPVFFGYPPDPSTGAYCVHSDHRDHHHIIVCNLLIFLLHSYLLCTYNIDTGVFLVLSIILVLVIVLAAFSL